MRCDSRICWRWAIISTTVLLHVIMLGTLRNLTSAHHQSRCALSSSSEQVMHWCLAVGRLRAHHKQSLPSAYQSVGSHRWPSVCGQFCVTNTDSAVIEAKGFVLRLECNSNLIKIFVPIIISYQITQNTKQNMWSEFIDSVEPNDCIEIYVNCIASANYRH